MNRVINAACGRTSRTIKADYFKMGGANAMPRGDGLVASFILKITKHEDNPQALAHIGSTKHMSSRNVIDPQGISPCLCSAMGLGGGHIPRIPVIKRIQ